MLYLAAFTLGWFAHRAIANALNRRLNRIKREARRPFRSNFY